jgi:DNA helicase II / ATP-dependent DNA helicase PcrA
VFSIDNLRRKAWAVRRELGFETNVVVSADDLLFALDRLTSISRFTVGADDSTLGGAMAILNLDLLSIFQADGFPADETRYNAAHEYAHWFLHCRESRCSTADMALDFQEQSSLPVAVVDGYSANERIESEANIFASELLLPLPLAKYSYSDLEWNSQRIAEEIGIPVTIARRQMTDAVLLPIPPVTPPDSRTVSVPLDPSQEAAATVPVGPVLLSAGPGTGKTKTLVGRCIYLTNVRKVAPDLILALTYSRKAAAEMSGRLISAGIGSVNSGPWTGTFHSFGMEVLRKYGENIGLLQGFKLIDRLDGVTLLENNYPQLELSVLANIYNPALYLDGILGQISRAKDELVNSAGYSLLVEEMTKAATEASDSFSVAFGKKTKKEEDKVKRLVRDAKRAAEVCHVYGVYERLKQEQNLVDYSDLIVRTVQLLETHPNVGERIHRQYPFVLADEYQDVNRASARLLRLIAGDARGLWVVGDHRQSIYQFQGASPANVALFQHEYPGGALKELQINYRSSTEIVETFSYAADHMSFSRALPTPSRWESFRGSAPGGRPVVCLAELATYDAQTVYIADQVKSLHESGLSYSDHAVLCRTHRQANELSASLNRAGVPAFYLGPLLDRPEIKGLISVLSVTANKGSSAVYKMASLPEYRISDPDAVRLAQSVTSENFDGQPRNISAESLAGFDLLKEHVQALGQYVDRPSSLIRAYIFDTSQYLKMLSSRGCSEFELTQSLLAIRRFIAIVEGFDHRAIVPHDDIEMPSRTAKLVRHLHRLTSIGASPAVPEGWSSPELNAVHVSTVHSAKGLEYPVVFLPNLNAGEFPSQGRQNGIPEPPGLSSTHADEFDEEECLFFVGLSRAKDHLFLTRSTTKADVENSSTPSPLLSTLSVAIERGVVDLITEGNSPGGRQVLDCEPTSVQDDSCSDLYNEHELERYMRCPRQYHFRNVLGLSGDSFDDGYLKLSRVINELVSWIDRQTEFGCPDIDIRLNKLEELWTAYGPVGHLHEPLYKVEAEAAARAVHEEVIGEVQSSAMTARLSNGVVQVRPDRTTVQDGNVTVTHRKSGIPGDSDHTDKRLALLRKAASDSYPGLNPKIQLRYVGNGVVADVGANARFEPARLKKYEDAIDGIREQRFDAIPESTDSCRTCAFLLICQRGQRG